VSGPRRRVERRGGVDTLPVVTSVADGSLLLAGVLVGPGTTRSSLLADAPEGSLACVDRKPWALLSGDASVDGVAFSGTATFEGERLDRVSVVVADTAVAGTSWSDYDPAVVRAWHDAFLAERLGKGVPWNGGAYPYGGVEYTLWWGTVGSYVHPQDSGAVIVLAYLR